LVITDEEFVLDTDTGVTVWDVVDVVVVVAAGMLIIGRGAGNAEILDAVLVFEAEKTEVEPAGVEVVLLTKVEVWVAVGGIELIEKLGGGFENEFMVVAVGMALLVVVVVLVEFVKVAWLPDEPKLIGVAPKVALSVEVVLVVDAAKGAGFVKGVEVI
jgi:hypothetical protein